MKFIKLVILATKFYWNSCFSAPFSSGSSILWAATVDGLLEEATGGFRPMVLDLVTLTLAAAAAAAYLFLAMKLVLALAYALVDGGISCLYTLGEATGLE